MNKPIHPSLSALLEVGLLFLPAIPAYIWFWPNMTDATSRPANLLAYAYVLAGTLFIGLRRWNPARLGLNRRGLWLSLACGALILLGRHLVILGVRWQLPTPDLTLSGVLGDLFFYICVVGLVEELLFRGLIFQALEIWRGARWAIWGSSLGFVLWHIFGQGPLIGLAGLIYGLIFALIRWRAGGILGLVLVHGLMDLQAAWMIAGSNEAILSTGRPQFDHPILVALGCALLVLVPLYLWKRR